MRMLYRGITIASVCFVTDIIKSWNFGSVGNPAGKSVHQLLYDDDNIYSK